MSQEAPAVLTVRFVSAKLNNPEDYKRVYKRPLLIEKPIEVQVPLSAEFFKDVPHSLRYQNPPSTRDWLAVAAANILYGTQLAEIEIKRATGAPHYCRSVFVSDQAEGAEKPRRTRKMDHVDQEYYLGGRCLDSAKVERIVRGFYEICRESCYYGDPGQRLCAQVNAALPRMLEAALAD